MITTTAKILHSTLLKIIFLLFLLIVALFFALTHGITIHRIDLPGMAIREFYIKLDKKLILTVENLQIRRQSHRGNSLKEIDTTARLLHTLPKLFERIELKRIEMGGEPMALSYQNGLFNLRTDDLKLVTRLRFDPAKKRVEADIRELLIVRPGIRIRGDFFYDISQKAWSGEGRYAGLHLEGKFRAWHRGHTIGFTINSRPTDSIKPLIDFLAPPRPIKVWIYPNIPARRYQLHYLRGEIALDSDGKIRFDPERIEGYATAWQAAVRFHPGVPPVTVRRIDVTYRHDTLDFKLHDPRYEGKNLDGSHVRIRHLTGGIKALLDAHIVARGRFDASVRKILQAYRIPIPFVQTAGDLSAVVDLSIALVKGRVVAYRGDYTSRFATLLFDGTFSVPVEDLHIEAREKKMTIRPCLVHLDPYLRARVEGVLDLEAKKGDFHTTIQKLRYPDKGDPLLAMEGVTLPVRLSFKKGVRFDIPPLKAALDYLPGGRGTLRLEDLSLWHPYFRGILSKITGGDLTARRTKEGGQLQAHLLVPNRILSFHHRPIHHFDINARYAARGLEATVGKKIRLTHRGPKTIINYHDLDIDLPALYSLLKPLAQTSGKAQGSLTTSIRVQGRNTTLSTSYAYLPCDQVAVEITTPPYALRFHSRHGRGSIRGTYRDGRMAIAGRNLPDRVIHGIPALRDLYGGSFNFDAEGTPTDFNGTITFSQTLWAKSAVYNNVLASLNSIPDLLTLKKPGFNPKGFKIREGAIQYRYKQPYFRFQSIQVYGESANIFGHGMIDLKQRQIDMKMRIQFLQSISNTVKNIPVAGYLLFGDDGTISVGLSVKGPLGDPKVSTSAARDIVTAPVNILKRTITLPFKLFE